MPRGYTLRCCEQAIYDAILKSSTPSSCREQVSPHALQQVGLAGSAARDPLCGPVCCDVEMPRYVGNPDRSVLRISDARPIEGSTVRCRESASETCSLGVPRT